MRISAEWMNLIDDRLLELLDEEGPLPVNEIQADDRILWTDQYVGRRCRKLTKAGLLNHIGNGVYSVTDEGVAYLEGEFDARQLEKPE